MIIKSTSLIFEKLTFFSLFQIFLKIFSKKNKIYFLRSSKFLANFILFLKIPIHKINLFEPNYLKNNESLQYKRLTLLKNLIDNFLDKKIKNENIFNLNPIYWRKLIGSFYYDKLNSKIDTIILLKEAKKSGKFENEEIFFYISGIPNFNFFKYLIKENSDISLKKSFDLRFFYPFPFLLIKPLLIYLACLIKFKNQNLDADTPKILIKYQDNIFDRYPNAGPLYWFKNSSIEKNNIFIYSEENLPLNVTKNINETGFNYINLFNSKNDIVNPINIIKLYKQYFLNIDFFKNLEVSSIKFYLIWKIECYKKIFQKYNVKMLNQHQEFSSDALSKNIALKILEGISFWSHWSSNNQLSAHYYYSFVDLILSWGKLDTDYYKIHKTSFEKIFEVGVVNGDCLNYDTENFSNSIKLNKKLKICLFDTSHSEETIYVNSKLILSFYKKALGFFKNKQNIQIFIKSKGYAFEKIKNDNEIIDLYKEMLHRQQVKIIDSKVTPSNIAKKCNLTISFDYNTTGIISGLLGVKSIFINSSKLNRYPFHLTFVKNNISYDNFEEFEKFFKNNDLNNIGNFDLNVKNNIDTFRDNFSNLRAGEIISKTFSLIKDKKNHKDIFKNIEFYYNEKWGNKNKNVTFEEKNLWH